MRTAKKLVNFRIDPDLLAELEAIRNETGATVSEQIREALIKWVRSYHRHGSAALKSTRPWQTRGERTR
ncbi:ribbon-helix-helix protein, CopG family [Luteitalea sp. TBR-22]|uniref:ribbon-helix-helix protein, CopG family n=1 Tax=Luteitalea sp. TBR-22 TaxID=2802971 RepID=UPI00351D3549